MEVVLIGSGSVATNLGLALHSKGITIKQVYSQNPRNAEILAKKLDADYISDISDIYMNADIYFYALKDSALKSMLRKIDIPSGIQVHTGGSIPMSEFDGHSTRYGVFYPLQTFSMDKIIDFSGVPICIEASNMDVQNKLVDLANLLSDKIFLMSSEQRRKIHLAAVFACNFTNYMYDIAFNILQGSGVPFEIMHPLITETAEKIKTITPFNAQTGPAVRMDVKTTSRHISMLSRKRDFKAVYKLLTKSIYTSHKK